MIPTYKEDLYNFGSEADKDDYINTIVPSVCQMVKLRHTRTFADHGYVSPLSVDEYVRRNMRSKQDIAIANFSECDEY